MRKVLALVWLVGCGGGDDEGGDDDVDTVAIGGADAGPAEADAAPAEHEDPIITYGDACAIAWYGLCLRIDQCGYFLEDGVDGCTANMAASCCLDLQTANCADVYGYLSDTDLCWEAATSYPCGSILDQSLFDNITSCPVVVL